MDPLTTSVATAAVPALLPSVLKDSENASDSRVEKWIKIVLILGVVLYVTHQINDKSRN